MANHYMGLKCKECGEKFIFAKNMSIDYGAFFLSMDGMKPFSEFIEKHSSYDGCNEDFSQPPFELFVED